MSLLPHQVFRRISLYIRVAVVMAMLTLLSTTFAVPRLLVDSGSSSSILHWIPPAWFLGLARIMFGKAEPQLVPLGTYGLKILGITLVLACVTYVLSYYRYFIRIPETLDITVRKKEPRKLLPDWLLDRVLLKTAFERACYRFALKALVRNERQLLFLGAFLGLGLVLASQILVSAVARKGAVNLPSAELLSLPLAVSYFVICGLCFVFEIPAELHANWAAQVIVDRQRHDAASLALKLALTLVWPWLILVAMPLYLWRWGWPLALGHTAVVMVMTYCLADWRLGEYRKIPFTCAYSPWKQNAAAVIILYAFGYLLFTLTVTSWERSVLGRGPGYLFLLAGGLLVLWKLLSRFRKDEFDPRDLVFEDSQAPAIELLNLTGRLPYD